MSNWWEQGQGGAGPGVPILSGLNETSDFSTGMITSELITTNPLTRSVLVTLPDLAASSGLSTGWAVWTPTVPITVTAARYYAISAAFTVSSSSGAVGSLYQNACGLIAALSLAETTGVPAGGSLAFGAVNSTATKVAAGTPITFGLVVASCCNAPLGQVQIDYVTTG